MKFLEWRKLQIIVNRHQLEKFAKHQKSSKYNDKSALKIWLQYFNYHTLKFHNYHQTTWDDVDFSSTAKLSAFYPPKNCFLGNCQSNLLVCCYSAFDISRFLCCLSSIYEWGTNPHQLTQRCQGDGHHVTTQPASRPTDLWRLSYIFHTYRWLIIYQHIVHQ